jgi:hypothetical protein
MLDLAARPSGIARGQRPPEGFLRRIQLGRRQGAHGARASGGFQRGLRLRKGGGVLRCGRSDQEGADQAGEAAQQGMPARHRGGSPPHHEPAAGRIADLPGSPICARISAAERAATSARAVICAS